MVAGWLAYLTMPRGGEGGTTYVNSPWFLISFLTFWPTFVATPLLLLSYFIDLQDSKGVISTRNKVATFLSAEAIFYLALYVSLGYGFVKAPVWFYNYVAPIWPGLPAFATILVGFLLRDKKGSSIGMQTRQVTEISKN